VSWTAPDDHGIVGSYGTGLINIPIYGVDTYEIFQKTATEDISLGTVPHGSVSFVHEVDDGVTVYQYYVKCIDGNPEHNVVSDLRSAISTTNLIGDFTGDGLVDGADFANFATNYNTAFEGNEASFVWAYDLDDTGVVDGGDFAIFATNYGTSLEVAKAAAASLPTSDIPFSLSADADGTTSTYLIHVNIDKTENLKGFEFFMTYDTEALEFLDNKVNGLVGLNLTSEIEEGLIRVTDWFVGEKFDGTVSLSFRSTGINKHSSIEIVNAIVDVDGLARITDVTEFEVKPIPTIYALSQNYPNPFNPTTTIDYSIPKSGHVELVIFNTAGQKVRTLVSEAQSAGFYKVVWDGRNDYNESVASGIYIYKLASGSFSKTVKMNLVK
jgi:hypothetical protein